MDIFKLIFEHDLRLDQLRERHLDRSVQEVSASVEDFMKPDPTYSKFYMTGTLLDEGAPRFGINRLEKYDEVIAALSKALDAYSLFLNGKIVSPEVAIEQAEIGRPMILSQSGENHHDTEPLRIGPHSNVGHKKEELAAVLETGDLVLYKEQAHQGFDLHLFSRHNIYPYLFYPLRDLIDHKFRFFSINGKRIRSERQFYFETWTLERPPHGAEEVFSGTRI